MDRFSSRVDTINNHGRNSNSTIDATSFPDSKGAFPIYPGDTRRKPDGTGLKARSPNAPSESGHLLSPASLHSVTRKSTNF